MNHICLKTGFFALAVASTPSCTSGFECGTPLDSDPERAHTCARPDEVCICATRSCARYDATLETDGSDGESAKKPCESKLRYVGEKAFVTRPELAGECVAPAHAQDPALVLNQRSGQTLCASLAGSGSTNADTSNSSETTTAETTTSTAGLTDSATASTDTTN